MNIPELKDIKQAIMRIKGFACRRDLQEITKQDLITLLSACQLLCDVSDKMPKVTDYDLESLPIEKLIENVIDDCNLWVTKNMMGITPEQLHLWYLQATSKIHKINFNPNAHKPYSELNEEQKFIDKYIATAIIQSFGQEKEGER